MSTWRSQSIHTQAPRGGSVSAPVEIDTAIIPSAVYREGSVVICVKGDSMENLFMNGSNLVVDTHAKEIVSGCVYAIRLPRDGCIVKECISEPAGLSLIPCNKNYQASSIKWDDFDPDVIIGRVTCIVTNVFMLAHAHSVTQIPRSYTIPPRPPVRLRTKMKTSPSPSPVYAYCRIPSLHLFTRDYLVERPSPSASENHNNSEADREDMVFETLTLLCPEPVHEKPVRQMHKEHRAQHH